MTNSTGFLPQIPQPFNGWLSWIFGPGWWVWLVLVVIVLGAWVANKGRVKTEKVLKEQPLTDVPSATEYLAEGKEDEAQQDEVEDSDVIGETSRADSPTSEKDERWGNPPPNPRQDQRMVTFYAAFEDVKDKTWAALVNSIKGIEPKVVLEAIEKKGVKVRDLVIQPTPEPPTEEIIEEMT